jgi:hypothetical protein
LYVSQLPAEEEEEALRSFGFKEALARKLVDRGRVVEAARLMCECGNIPEAARLIDSKGSEAGREAVALSAELHITYALSGNCKDQQESLQNALNSCKRLKEIDEEALKVAQKKVDEMLEVRHASRVCMYICIRVYVHADARVDMCMYVLTHVWICVWICVCTC